MAAKENSAMIKARATNGPDTRHRKSREEFDGGLPSLKDEYRDHLGNSAYESRPASPFLKSTKPNPFVEFIITTTKLDMSKPEP